MCLCIKSILAASHILWQEGLIDEKEHIKFYCREDVLETKLNTDFIEIKIPLTLEKNYVYYITFLKR